jgi:long-subunit fatty acid transport protein
MMTSTFVLVLAGLAVPTVAYAQGYGVYEHSACGMARAAAGVADPCSDGSAIVDNPAAIVGSKGMTLGGGLLLVTGRSPLQSDDGTRAELDPAVSPVPFAYVA